MFCRRIFTAIIGFAAFMVVSNGAFAAAGPWWTSDHGNVRLIADSDYTGAGDTLRLGLEFAMKPGWKIYWRSPGDAGFPPKPNWAGSTNLASVDIDWPAPKRFTVLGLKTLGYEGGVILPLTVRLLEPGKDMSLVANVQFLTCREICVPYDAALTLQLPSGAETNSQEGALIDKFAARVPTSGGQKGLSILAAMVDGPPGAQSLRLTADISGSVSDLDVLVEAPPGFYIGDVKSVGRGRNGTRMLVASVSPPVKSVKAGNPTDLMGASLVLTSIDGARAVEQTLTVQRGQIRPPPTETGWLSLVGVLALALAGGLILNLMPCVLPVLSLKLLSVVGHGGGDHRAVRRGFLASAAGILVSFLILGTGAVLLKATGQAAGWGIQFQQPLFLTLMAVVVALFAANLWGLFEIRLPGVISDRAATTGQGHGMAGHFSTGVFAALLATPCSAPFLGTAVGFALARGAPEIYMIFTALGTGLALPYLLVAAMPSLATNLPRPGAWMVTLRRILGFALLATAAWLLTVLDTQIGRPGALLAGGLLILLFGVLALRRIRIFQNMAWPVLGVVMLSAVIAPPLLVEVQPAPATIDANTVWQKFDPEAIPGLVAAGKTVFVDVTADWCITCKINKALVLDDEDVASRLKADGIVAMQADWTRPSEQIAAFLASFNRYGIPFNAVFGPRLPQGRVLGELLTTNEVLSTLDAAAGPTSYAEQ
jgi:suppressor for copper-sensitivity B